jgi:S1-C subfamily serine protease
MRLLACRTWFVLATAIVAGLWMTPARSQPSEETVKPLIVMIAGELAGSPAIGAGIIVGVGSDRLYIATANHVVRRGAQEAQKVRVRLRALPGEWIDARLLEDRDSELDLAVLSVPGVKQRGIPVDALPFGRVGDPGVLKRGDEVYHVGYANGEPWRVNVNPDRISGKVGDLLKFESSSIAPGNSGGGLFNARWQLVGMVRADQPPDGVAVSIARIRATMTGWGYPVSLSAAEVVGEVTRNLRDAPPKTTPARPAPVPEAPRVEKKQPLNYAGFNAIGRYPTVVQVFDPG